MSISVSPPFSGSINHRHVIPFSAHFPLQPSSRSCSSLTTWRFSSQTLKRRACGPIRSQVEAEDATVEEACELVNGSELTIGDGSDSIHAYLFKAVKNNNGTGILLLSDIFGFQDSSTRDFAYRTACNGYNVLVPDLFRGNPWRSDRPRSMLEEWLATQDPERVAKDIDISKKWMVEEFVAAGISKKLGIIGFCYGGGRVIQVLARDHDSCFGTGVSFYGTRIDKSAFAGVKVPLLFIAGDEDTLCPVDTLSELAQTIGNDSNVVVFKGRGHGFAHRPQSTAEDTDADQAFLAMRNWLHNRLLLPSVDNPE